MPAHRRQGIHIFLVGLLVLAGCDRASQGMIPGSQGSLTPGIIGTATPVSPGTPPANTPDRPADTLTPSPTQPPTPAPTPTPTPAILAGAGDISICGQKGDDATAELLAGIPGEIFTAGDSSNEAGTTYQFINCFDPSWGQFKDRIHPVPGNHEYETGNANDYFDYFGEAAGPRGKGYYSYNLGEWHIVALNSNCLAAGCGFDSPQVQWLREDLAANRSRCTLAYWHVPRWSSGLGGSASWVRGFWDTLYEYGAEVVINGDEHNYERFAPQDPQGSADPERGIREFVVGTGGAGHLGFGDPLPNSEVRNYGTYGVIKFTLYPDRYDWEFIPAAGETFTDSGTGYCHD